MSWFGRKGSDNDNTPTSLEVGKSTDIGWGIMTTDSYTEEDDGDFSIGFTIFPK